MAEPMESSVRAENIATDDVVVRGNPLTIQGLLGHAQRTATIFTWRGEALLAVSAAVTGVGRSVDDLLASPNLRTRSTFASAPVATLVAAGFEVLPTFAAPHVSIVLPKYDDRVAELLLAALGPVQQNPHRERRFR